MFIPTENMKKRYPKVIIFDVESFHSVYGAEGECWFTGIERYEDVRHE